MLRSIKAAGLTDGGLTKTAERVGDTGTKAVHERGPLAVMAHQPYPDAIGLGLASPIHYQLVISAPRQQWMVYVGLVAIRLSRCKSR